MMFNHIQKGVQALKHHRWIHTPPIIRANGWLMGELRVSLGRPRSSCEKIDGRDR